MSPVGDQSHFIKRSGRHKASFTPKQSNNYKPSLFRKSRKFQPNKQLKFDELPQDNTCNDRDYHEVLLSDKRCYDNTLQVRMGNVKAVALVDTGATISCISHSLLSKIQPKHVQYMHGDISKTYGVGNIVQDVSAKVQFDFHVDQQKFKNSFYTIQNQYPLILGMDFITKYKGILDFTNSTITLNNVIHEMSPPPRRSTLVKTKHAQIIDAYTSQDIPVCLSKPVQTACMLVEPISSLTRRAPGLELPIAVVSSQSTVCRLTNDTDTPISIPAGCVIAIARNIVLNDVTEMIDFLDRDSEVVLQVNPEDQARLDDNDDFNDIMSFPELADDDSSNPDDNPNFDIDNPTLSAQEVAEFIAFLVRNKKAFATTLARLGYSSEFYHTIDTGDAKPVALRFYRTSPKIQKEIDTQIEELLKYGIIEASTSAWASPVDMVR